MLELPKQNIKKLKVKVKEIESFDSNNTKFKEKPELERINSDTEIPSPFT